jgi:hypothetical protein
VWFCVPTTKAVGWDSFFFRRLKPSVGTVSSSDD